MWVTVMPASSPRNTSMAARMVSRLRVRSTDPSSIDIGVQVARAGQVVLWSPLRCADGRSPTRPAPLAEAEFRIRVDGAKLAKQRFNAPLMVRRVDKVGRIDFDRDYRAQSHRTCRI